MSVLHFAMLVLASLSFAYVFKWRYSGVEYEKWKYYFGGGFNFLFMCIYMRFVDQGCIVFTECLGKKSQNYPLMGAMSLIAAMLHAVAMPSASK